MADPVALTSVITSAAIAGGSLWFNYRSSREQRDHEARQGFEGRAWEVKSTALFACIATATRLLDTLDTRSPAQQMRALSLSMDELNQVVAPVETYASGECRSAFSALRSRVLTCGANPDYHKVTETLERDWFKANDSGSSEDTRRVSRQQTEFFDIEYQRLKWQPEELRPLAEALISEARASLRSTGT